MPIGKTRCWADDNRLSKDSTAIKKNIIGEKRKEAQQKRCRGLSANVKKGRKGGPWRLGGDGGGKKVNTKGHRTEQRSVGGPCWD